MRSIGPDKWWNSISLRCGNELSHFLSTSRTLTMVLSISWASILNSRSPSSAEIQKFPRRQCGCFNFSPPTTAKSIYSLLPFNPRSFANCFRVTVVPEPLSIKTFLSRTLPLGALNLALTTGIILALSKTEAAPGCAAFTGMTLPTGGRLGELECNRG